MLYFVCIFLFFIQEFHLFRSIDTAWVKFLKPELLYGLYCESFLLRGIDFINIARPTPLDGVKYIVRLNYAKITPIPNFWLTDCCRLLANSSFMVFNIALYKSV